MRYSKKNVVGFKEKKKPLVMTVEVGCSIRIGAELVFLHDQPSSLLTKARRDEALISQ